MALFVLPDPQILGMLIGVDGVERLVNKVRVNFKSYKISQMSAITRGQVICKPARYVITL